MNKFEVLKAKEKCKNPNELARALMRIVFTEDALKNCSMTGKKAKGIGKTDNVKPGLNENGVEAILSMHNKNF